MLRRQCPVNYKHIMMSDSETESDDSADNRVIVGQRKRNRKGSVIDKKNLQSKKNGKGEKFTSSTNEVAKSGPNADQVAKPIKLKPNVDPDALVELATQYQKYMKKIPIPKGRVANAVVVNWKGLAKTLKALYGQPLHYLTYMLCKQWDQERFGSEDEQKPLDAIFKWSSAETTIWNVEEIHRLCTSPIHLAKLWLSDPEYRTFVDEVLPSP